VLPYEARSDEALMGRTLVDIFKGTMRPRIGLTGFLRNLELRDFGTGVSLPLKLGSWEDDGNRPGPDAALPDTHEVAFIFSAKHQDLGRGKGEGT
jgi:hypothetical protein